MPEFGNVQVFNIYWPVGLGVYQFTRVAQKFGSHFQWHLYVFITIATLCDFMI